MTNPTKTALQIYWAAHQPEIDWLFDQSFPFAVSLQGSLKRFGGLTTNQLSALRKCMERGQADAVRAAEPKAAVDISAIETCFAKAKADGAKYPRLRLADFVFSPASVNGKNAGSIYVKAGDVYLGKVQGGSLFRSRDCTPEQGNDIVAAAADPKSAAIAYGKKYGRCSICARDLSDEDSVARGMGAVCAKRFGWSK
jgi:hypothetical protein